MLHMFVRVMQEEAPEVPLYATAYLNLNEIDDKTSQFTASASAADPNQAKALRTCFTQPGVMPDFLDKVRQKKVTLLIRRPIS